MTPFPAAHGWFVTGTDTGVGKTRAALALMRACQRQGHCTIGMKPVASGCQTTPVGLRNSDALALLRQSNLDAPYEWINPYVLQPPIAPHLAAAQAGIRLEITPIIKAYQRLRPLAQRIVVEGAGGWRVPINEGETLADVALALRLPVVLVVGLRLGCINHALLTAEAIARDGAPLVGWIGSAIDSDYAPDTTLETLRARIAAPCWGWIRHGGWRIITGR